MQGMGIAGAVGMIRKCSHCGHNGHNSRTCPDRGGGGRGGFKLFGVRLLSPPESSSSSPCSSSSSSSSSSSPSPSPLLGAGGERERQRESGLMMMRKSMSMGCLSHLAHSAMAASPFHSSLTMSPPLPAPHVQDPWDGAANVAPSPSSSSVAGGGAVAAMAITVDGGGGGGEGGGDGDNGDGNNDGYLSDGMMHSSCNGKERKKGVPWTEEEHRMFLVGLQKLGRGDWRGIARNFVGTRTPTQVASHAQKYFLRQSNLPKRKRRSSLFDIPADAVGCLGGEPPFKVPARSTGFMSLSRSSSSPALHYLDNNHTHTHTHTHNNHNASQDHSGRTLSLRNTFTPLGNPDLDPNTNNGTFLHLWPTSKPYEPITLTPPTPTITITNPIIATPLLTTPSNSFSQPPPNSSPKEDTSTPVLTLSIAPPSMTDNNNMHINTTNTNNSSSSSSSNNNNNNNNNQAALTCHGSPSKNRSLISVV